MQTDDMDLTTLSTLQVAGWGPFPRMLDSSDDGLLLPVTNCNPELSFWLLTIKQDSCLSIAELFFRVRGPVGDSTLLPKASRPDWDMQSPAMKQSMKSEDAYLGSGPAVQLSSICISSEGWRHLCLAA